MIHPAVFAVFLLDTISQANTGSDPIALRLAVASLPSIFALGVAWLTVRLTSDKDQKQWVRDQKLKEWKDLIELVAEYQRLMPAGQPGLSCVNAVRNDILPLCDRIVHSSSRALLIAPTLSAHSIRPLVFQIIQETDEAIGRIEIYPQSPPADRTRLGSQLDNAMAIRSQLEKLHTKLIDLAHKDLRI
jgi:hypothetical protein